MLQGRGALTTGLPADEQFLAEVQIELRSIVTGLGSPLATLDMLFLAYLRKASRFGFFAFGPVTLAVGLIEDRVLRAPAAGEPGAGAAPYSDDCVRFFSRLTEEVRRSHRRRIDELHFLLAFMRTPEGLPALVFGELGVRPEQVEAYARGLQGGRDAGAIEALYSPEAAAEYLGVHVQTVRLWIRDGHLPASRLAGQRVLRIRASDLQRLLEPVDPVDFDN